MNIGKFHPGLPGREPKRLQSNLQQLASPFVMDSFWPLQVDNEGGQLLFTFDVSYEDLRPITLEQFTTDQNDLPFGEQNWLLISSDAACNLTGISGGEIGNKLYLTNTGSFNITLKNFSSFSDDGNKFLGPGGNDFVLSAGASAPVIYDGTYWRIASQGAFGTVIGTTTYGTSSDPAISPPGVLSMPTLTVAGPPTWTPIGIYPIEISTAGVLYWWNGSAWVVIGGTTTISVVDTYSAITYTGVTSLEFDTEPTPTGSGFVVTDLGGGAIEISQEGVVTGSGTTNYLPRWTGSTALTDSAVSDDGTVVVSTRRVCLPTTVLNSGGTHDDFPCNQVIDVDNAGTTTLRGVDASSQPYGCPLFIFNKGAGTLTIKYNDSNSMVLNRFILPGAADLVLPSGEGATFVWYDYWRCTGKTV